MTFTDEAARLDLPGGWVPLPPPEIDQKEWAEEYVAGLEIDEYAANSLRFGLIAVMDMAAGMRKGERHSFAFVDDPSSGLVRALLSTQMWRLPVDKRDAYRDRLVSANAQDGLEVINQTIEERTVAAGVAIVMHDFTVVREEGEQPIPALERAVVAVFLEGTDAMIELSMFTQDLLLFDDMSLYLVELADSLVPAPEKPIAQFSSQEKSS